LPRDARAAAPAPDRAAAAASLLERVAAPLVREAIYLASPSLDAALDALQRDAAMPRAHDALLPLARYVARMSERPTPFGLFAGCALGALGARTALELAPRARSRRRTRLDMHYLTALTE